jgi:hypothetical protein
MLYCQAFLMCSRSVLPRTLVPHVNSTLLPHPLTQNLCRKGPAPVCLTQCELQGNLEMALSWSMVFQRKCRLSSLVKTHEPSVVMAHLLITSTGLITIIVPAPNTGKDSVNIY